MNNLVEMIKKHEGLRLKPYRDPEGILTIGYGRNLEDKGISEKEAEILLQNDIKRAEADLKQVIPEIRKINIERFNVLVDMIFNLGINRFKKFKKMIKAIKTKNYEKAAEEMLNSKWAGQVKGRALELAEIMKKGE